MKNNKKMSGGITLIALVVTIIVLLILAGITVAMLTGENGILQRTKDAKENSEIAKEKEIVETSTIQAMEQNKFGVLKQSELQSKLNDYANIDERIDVMEDGENLIVYFSQSNRYYQVNSNGDVENFIVYKDSTPGELAGSGNENDPFKIECIEDLVVFSMMTQNGGNSQLGIGQNNFKNQFVSLERSLDFKTNFSYDDYNTKKYGDLNNDGIIEDIKTELTKQSNVCTGFTPVNNFKGTFSGKNNWIKNIYINRTDQYVGLFSRADRGAKIEGLSISGNIKTTHRNCAGFIGVCGNGDGFVTVENCHNYCDIQASNYAGGIVRIFKG